jgi:glutamyl-tRNA synthetase
MNEGSVRVRFAPAPTGFLHLGSARTALFNWLHARHVDGKLILRIEDTDRERSKSEFLDEIMEDLRWLGIDWDEGPLFQSERIPEYAKFATALLDKGLAYREGQAVIFRVEKSREIKINDIVHGEIVFNTDEIKDQVLIKSDGLPAYNFACVIDDSQMNITHIIRGDDHVSNTPKQMLLYEALGLRIPHFAHMPLMMGKDGAKLSKRHGAVAVSEYRNEGFLPQALANYLALLGWSPGGDRELITMEEAIRLFDVAHLSDVQARFDIDKLKWINGEYIKKMHTADLAELLRKTGRVGGAADQHYVEKVTELYKTRFRTLNEFTFLTEGFFKDDFQTEEAALKKRDTYLGDETTKRAISEFAGKLEQLEPFEKEAIEKACRNLAETYNIKPATIIHPTRVALSGRTAGAGLFEMMELLGKVRVVERLKKLTR